MSTFISIEGIRSVKEILLSYGSNTDPAQDGAIVGLCEAASNLMRSCKLSQPCWSLNDIQRGAFLCATGHQ